MHGEKARWKLHRDAMCSFEQMLETAPNEKATIWLLHRLIDLVGRVFANGPGDRGSIPGHVIPNTLKMVLDTSLLNTQQYKVHIKDKEEQSRERSSDLPYTLVW